MTQTISPLRRFLLLSALFAVGSATHAATIPPVQVAKRQIKVIRSECYVVGTEAARAAITIRQPVPHATELWSRISENNNTAFAMSILFIPLNRDVLGNGAAPSGLGWRPEFLDIIAGANQRHHYGFYFYIGATESITAGLGAILNTYNDEIQNNQGDLTLAAAAKDLGIYSRLNGVPLDIGRRHKTRFCL